MKNVYFVQVGVTATSPCFLPYSVGCIVAYLKNDKEINENYNIANIIGYREKIEDVLKRFDNPAVVGFCCFTWNLEYNKILAKKLKELYPEVKIIFGGHSVPAEKQFLEEYDFIDYLMHNEGEETTALFLKALSNNKDLNKIPNLSFRKNNVIITTEDYHPNDLSNYPSPYTSGVFDHLFAEFPNIKFHATLETNRGCPYACAYCEWCFTKKIREFPIEKIKAEIEWIAKNKIEYCYCADANFGILKRDIEIAEYIVSQNKKYGYPQVFKPCYAKESDDIVFQAGYLLNKNQIDKGVTLAYQTLDKTTLENIGRKNLTLEHFASLDTRYGVAGIPTYTELIIGLPGETYESFCKGMCQLLESGQDNSMTVYECQVFANSPMGDPEYQKKHKIIVSRIPLYGIHYNPEFNGVNEFIDIVTETATMTKDEWVKGNMFSVILQVFHHLGLLRYFAIYLHEEHKITYYEFYNMLYEFIYKESTGYINELFQSLYDRRKDTVKADWTYKRDVFGTTGWYFEEGAFLEFAYHSNTFWQEILPFLTKFNIDGEIFSDLFEFQKKLIRLPGVDEVEINLKYNLYPYFIGYNNGIPVKLIKQNNTLHIKVHNTVTNWSDYAREIIWFGKRYSATLLINPRSYINYQEE